LEFELKRWKEKYINELASAADCQDVARWMNDSFHSPFTEEHAADFVSARLYADDLREFSRAVIVDGRVAGGIHLEVNDDIYSKTANVSFWLAPQFQHNRIMSDALRLFVRQAFERLDLARINAFPFAGNTAARCVLNNSGFELEGIMKNAAFKDNCSHNLCIYAFLREQL